MDDLVEFAVLIEDEVANEVAYASVDFGSIENPREAAFTRILLQEMESAGVLESPTGLKYHRKNGAQEVQVNGYGIPDDEGRLDLVITDYRIAGGGEVFRLNANEVDKKFKQVLRFVDFVLLDKPMRTATEQTPEEVAMIRNISSRKFAINRVHITLITNGQLSIRREKARPEKLKNLTIVYDVWDIDRLKKFRSSGASHEAIEVDLMTYGGLPCLSNSDPTGNYCTYISVIPGAILADWYEEYGSRLLEMNVRSYLQAKGKINRGILDTLTNEPERFLAYNNGITIVAEEVELQDGQELITKIIGLQVVNGGQTTASIHRARKEKKADLSSVFVLAKITRVPHDQFEEIVPEISKLSNTQNKVNDVDLRANHPFHVGIERASKKRWTQDLKSKWFYERARGSYQTERARAGKGKLRDKFDHDFPSSQKLTKEDVSRYVNAYESFPYIVSLGGQKNFKHYMDHLPTVTKDWEPSEGEYKELIAKAMLYRGAQKIAAEIGIAAFRINVVTYTVSLVVFKAEQRIDLIRIWAAQDLSDAVKAQFKQWLPEIERLLVMGAVGSNPTEWFKTDKAWKYLIEKTKSWALSIELQRELIAPNARGLQAETDIVKCKALDANAWLEIYQWAEQNQDVNRMSLEVASRIVGLAVGGWRQEPTAKQAAIGVEAIRMYSLR